jgi:hypothetical protein
MGDIGLDGVIILQWMLNRMERGVCGLVYQNQEQDQ